MLAKSILVLIKLKIDWHTVLINKNCLNYSLSDDLFSYDLLDQINSILCVLLHYYMPVYMR